MAKFDTAEQVMVGLIHQQRPSTGKEISTASQIPAATVNRTLQELIDRGFVERWNAFSPGEPLHPKRSHVTINFRRPGILQFLDYLHIEHGANYEPFQQWDEQAHGAIGSQHLRTPIKELSDAYQTLDSQLTHFLYRTEPYAPQQRRELEHKIATILTQVARSESYFQDIYSEVKEEQARSLVHSLMKLSDRLALLRPDTELQNQRNDLTALAITAVWCFRIAEELWDFTQMLWGAGTTARVARQIRLSLANAFIQTHVPSHEQNFAAYHQRSELLLPIAKGLWADQQLRDSRERFNHPDNGDAGDILLAVQFRQHAMALYDLAQEIRLQSPFNELGLHLSPLPEEHEDFQRFFTRDPEETDEDYRARFKESWAQYKLPEEPFYSEAGVWDDHTEDLPDTTGARWRQINIPTQMLRTGDVITHTRTAELPYPILVTATDDSTITLTLGHGYNVPFNRQWLSHHGELTAHRQGA
ncbi:helix-turn-helix domain-containing protein [Glutamicibacter arilaitensis]|uniref:helix-turn-helix domain-containing protein n=1 Tax=Glutamicibacter arilaitensis TaxID=256701 RepID=UPI003FD49FCC